VQTVQTLGADCADFGCRLCSSGPGKIFLGADCAATGRERFFLGADCADFGCRLCSSGPGMFFLGADCADFGCRLCRLWTSSRSRTLEENEIHVIRLLLQEE